MKSMTYSPTKRYGIEDFSNEGLQRENISADKDLTKIVLMMKGSLTIDFTDFHNSGPELFFIRPGQYIKLHKNSSGSIIYYTPHLYASEIDDHDLVFGGMLFNGTQERPALRLDEICQEAIESFFERIRKECFNTDQNQETMIRAEIKQLVVTCTRIWRSQYGKLSLTCKETDFSRFFNKLVEHHFIRCHAVSDYAAMLNISPKALNKRVTKYGRSTPGDIIRGRIILEAKRMLIHTHLTVKEISYKLGYDDPSYFIRFFGKEVHMAPQNYRKYFMSGLNAVA